MKNLARLFVAAVVASAICAIAPVSSHAAAAAVSIGPVTASTNTSATASTGTNFYPAGNAQIDTVYITKNNTNSTVVWITTDQGVTVYSNTIVNATTATTRPRLLPTDVGGTVVNTNAVPLPISFSGNLYLNAFSAVGLTNTVTATITLQR